VELSDTVWYRIVLSGSVTNPTVGIRLAVSGDAVAMDYGQVEDGLYATSPILTTTATVTRAFDNATVEGDRFTDFYDYGNSAFILSGEALGDNFVNAFAISLRNNTTNISRIFGRGVSGAFCRPAIGGADFVTSFGIESTNRPVKFKEVFTYGNGFASVSINGFTPTEQYNVVLPILANNLRVAGSQTFTLKSLSYIPKTYNSTAIEDWSTK
jgi:hypothetical protein